MNHMSQSDFLKHIHQLLGWKHIDKELCVLWMLLQEELAIDHYRLIARLTERKVTTMSQWVLPENNINNWLTSFASHPQLESMLISAEQCQTVNPLFDRWMWSSEGGRHTRIWEKRESIGQKRMAIRKSKCDEELEFKNKIHKKGRHSILNEIWSSCGDDRFDCSPETHTRSVSSID